jgi:hypothetical protein
LKKIENKDEKKLINITIYLLATLLLVLSFIFIYLFTNYTFIKKDDFVNNYKKIDQLKFEDLNISIQKKYKIIEIIPQKPKDQNQTKITKLIDNTDNIKVEDKNTTNNKSINLKKKVIDKLTYKSVMCTDMNRASFNITNTCIDNYSQFIKNNKEPKYYEVIPLISEDDFTNEDFKLDSKKRELARKRVDVIIKRLRDIVKPNIEIQSVKYYLVSKKSYKGVVIRAYY